MTRNPRPFAGMSATLSSDPAAPLPTRAQMLAAREREALEASTGAGRTLATFDDEDPAPAAPAPVVEAAVPVVPVRTAPRGAVSAHLPTAGEFLYAAANRDADPASWESMRARVNAAAPDTITTDVPGLIPIPIWGQVIETRATDRPLTSAFLVGSGPDAGKSFLRPKITDPIADAAAAGELVAVADTLGVTDLTVTRSYIKRGFRLSAEAMAFTSPDVLGVAVTDLARAYARGTEKSVAAALVAQATHAAQAISEADPWTGLYAAASTVYAGCGDMPDVLVMDPTTWALLGGLTGSDGHPLFPYLSPQNANGANPDGVRGFSLNALGLRPVVSWALAAGKAFMASSEFVEVYESHRTSMRSEDAGVMGLNVATGGAVATLVTEVAAVVPLTFGALQKSGK